MFPLRVRYSGNHMFTIKANDFGHPVDEADFENNQKEYPLDTEHAHFPNLKVNNINWDGVIGEEVDGMMLTITAEIENDGTADAES